MWVSKRTYEDLLLSHKREVDILTSWIEQLQGQVGANFRMTAPTAPSTSVEAIRPDLTLHVSEDEQDAEDALEMGLITKDQYDEYLAHVRGQNVEVLSS